MSAARNRELMEIYLHEVLAKRAFERIEEIAAPDLVDHLQPTLRGPAALDAHARGFCENTPEVAIEVVRIFATEDTAVGIWRWSGTPKYPSTTSAKGTPVSPRLIASVFQIEDGRVRDYRVFVDALDVFTQLAQ